MYIPLEKMLDKNKSLFKLTLVAAERANQIMQGSKPLVVNPVSKRETTIALQEISEGKVYYKDEE